MNIQIVLFINTPPKPLLWTSVTKKMKCWGKDSTRETVTHSCRIPISGNVCRRSRIHHTLLLLLAWRCRWTVQPPLVARQ